MENTEENKGTLLDTLHNCLMCNAQAYEVRKNKYECSDTDECNFTWEVLDCEE